ncbi:cyclic nucleotide-binding domain-containing protein [Thermodesulfobacteriota bacterium]
MDLGKMIEDMPMFDEFTDGELKIFSKMDHVLEKFHKGDMILHEGEDLTSIYLILKGNVLIVRKGEVSLIRLARLKPGEIFGEMSFFTKKPRRSGAMANDKVLVLKMDEDFFQKVKPAMRDKVKNYFIGLLVKRLDAMNESIMTISRLMRS